MLEDRKLFGVAKGSLRELGHVASAPSACASQTPGDEQRLPVDKAAEAGRRQLAG